MTNYTPPFSFTAPIVEKVSRISELIGIWSARSASHLTPILRRGNRIKTIQASLAIEQNDGVNDGVSDGVTIKLDGLDQEILDSIKQNPHITLDQFVELTGKSLSTIQRRIRKLRQRHIKRIGSDKTGYWKIND